MKCLKYFKKLSLIRKYGRSDKKVLDHIHLVLLLGRNHPAVDLSLHYMDCERRFCERINKL